MQPRKSLTALGEGHNAVKDSSLVFPAFTNPKRERGTASTTEMSLANAFLKLCTGAAPKVRQSHCRWCKPPETLANPILRPEGPTEIRCVGLPGLWV